MCVQFNLSTVRHSCAVLEDYASLIIASDLALAYIDAQLETSQPRNLAPQSHSRVGYCSRLSGFSDEPSWAVWHTIPYVLQFAPTARVNLFSVLGATEAGLFPGAIYVFSIFYRR